MPLGQRDNNADIPVPSIYKDTKLPTISARIAAAARKGEVQTPPRTLLWYRCWLRSTSLECNKGCQHHISIYANRIHNAELQWPNENVQEIHKSTMGWHPFLEGDQKLAQLCTNISKISYVWLNYDMHFHVVVGRWVNEKQKCNQLHAEQDSARSLCRKSEIVKNGMLVNHLENSHQLVLKSCSKNSGAMRWNRWCSSVAYASRLGVPNSMDTHILGDYETCRSVKYAM